MPNRTITLTVEEWSEVCNALRSAANRYDEFGQDMRKLAKEGNRRDAQPSPVYMGLSAQFWTQAEHAHGFARRIEETPDDGAEPDLLTLVEANGF